MAFLPPAPVRENVQFQDGILARSWVSWFTQLTNILNSEEVIQSGTATQFDNATTTLANIAALTNVVNGGATYRFVLTLYTTSNVAAGVKVALGGGTATATSLIADYIITDTTVTKTRTTALATSVGVTAVTAALVQVTGTITVNVGGTLIPQFAENVANAAPSSVLIGSTFVVTRLS